MDKAQQYKKTHYSVIFDNIFDILAFVTPAAYRKLVESRNEFAELLPVAPVFKHPRNKDNSPGYYSDIIIHIDGKLVFFNTQ